MENPALGRILDQLIGADLSDEEWVRVTGEALRQLQGASIDSPRPVSAQGRSITRALTSTEGAEVGRRLSAARTKARNDLARLQAAKEARTDEE